jgi:hypothetical protein
MMKPTPYFKSKPLAGRASPKGFADGVNSMAHTLQTLDILGGRVEWFGDNALIIPPDINNYGGEGGFGSQLFRVRYFDGKIQIYGVGGDRMYQINGKRLPHETEPAAGEVYDWWDYKTGAAAADFHAVIYVVPVAPMSGDPPAITPFDYTNPETYTGMRYGFFDAFSDAFNAPVDWTRRAAVI